MEVTFVHCGEKDNAERGLDENVVRLGFVGTDSFDIAESVC